jgi:lysophospholipase L1-like esterase
MLNILQRNYRRTNQVTSTYAAAVRALAIKLSVPLLDVYALFNNYGDWQNKLLSPDGLHLSPQGQEAIFKGLQTLIEQDLPHLK